MGSLINQKLVSIARQKNCEQLWFKILRSSSSTCPGDRIWFQIIDSHIAGFAILQRPVLFGSTSLFGFVLVPEKWRFSLSWFLLLSSALTTTMYYFEWWLRGVSPLPPFNVQRLWYTLFCFVLVRDVDDSPSLGFVLLPSAPTILIQFFAFTCRILHSSSSQKPSNAKLGQTRAFAFILMWRKMQASPRRHCPWRWKNEQTGTANSLGMSCRFRQYWFWHCSPLKKAGQIGVLFSSGWMRTSPMFLFFRRLLGSSVGFGKLCDNSLLLSFFDQWRLRLWRVCRFPTREVWM